MSLAQAEAYAKLAYWCSGTIGWWLLAVFLVLGIRALVKWA